MVSLRAAFFSARVKIRVNSSGKPWGNTWLEIRSLEGVREKALLDMWQMRDGETMYREVYSGTLWKEMSPSHCENSLISYSAMEDVWENNVLLALWIANYNNKPFVRNLSIEFYFKWMLQMTTLHSTKSLSSAYRYRTCEREIAFDAAALTITPYWSLLVGVKDVGQVNWKKLSISSKVLPKVPLNNSMFKVWRFWFEMPCACSLEVFTRAELNASKLQSFNYTNRCPNQHSSVKLFFGDLFLNRNETNGELETDLVHFVYQS